MQLTVNEPVDALVIYRRGAPHPHLRAFRWKHRRYDVTTTHLVHREREGEAIHRIYSVSCDKETYVLCFDADHAQWTLETLETAS